MNKTKVTPESWVVRQPQKLQTEKKKISVEEEDPFFDQIKYFLYVCRLLGRLPFERTKSGGFMFQLCSPVMVFTILMNAVQIYLTYQVYFINLTTLFSKNESYDDGVKLVLMVVILNVHFYAWVFVLIETGNISEYLNHWQQFNKKHKYLLKGLPSMKRQMLWLVLFLFIVIAVLTVTETQYLLKGLPWYCSIPYFTVAYHISVGNLHWYINCIIFARMGTELIEQLVKVLKNNTEFEEVHSVRCVWQKLNSLVKECHRTHANSVYYCLGISFISFTLASYGTLTGLLEKSANNLFSYIIPLLFFVVIIYICCDGPHRLHNKLGFEMINTLLACKMRHLKKETQQEIEMFLDIIEADPPVISIKGYFILNRQIFTAAVSTAVTYLVVLVQFKISSITT
uniref:Gustatory receptor n=1 Tax=Subpsaltria yangi TaxID=1195109 RepID=A0A385IUW1_9HEMI|nr:gustatory receptor 22.2 [Subpsaltria yangi]